MSVLTTIGLQCRSEGRFHFGEGMANYLDHDEEPRIIGVSAVGATTRQMREGLSLWSIIRI